MAVIYHNTGGLVLLHIDSQRLGARVVYENLEGGAELFPHVYGPLEVEAVVQATPFEPDSDGRFDQHRL